MRHPLLYEINTSVYLRELANNVRADVGLSDIPESEFEEWADRGFEWIWFLGVWQIGPKARTVSRTDPKILAECKKTLPDFTAEDICGSPFAIQAYRARDVFGGEAGLKRLRERLHQHGQKLVLDFVPNHVSPDHDWISSHPEYFIAGTEEDLKREPQNWGRFETSRGSRILAYGKDPYFSGWQDTAQLNYRHPALRQAMLEQLENVAERCDGVRCDMAMLIEPDIFAKTWGDRALPGGGLPPADLPFWPEAIARVKRRFPHFLFMAEVYWDMEWRLQQHGFDYTYDKRLYDRLEAGEVGAVRGHLLADPAFQNHSARFLENHDEPRAAAVFPYDRHRASAALTYFIPGLRFFHEGQFEGRKVRVSMHLCRRPAEPIDTCLQPFYASILECLQRPELHEGTFQLWQPREAWPGNPTWNNYVAFSWKRNDESFLLGVVNYGPTQAQCYVPIHLDQLTSITVTLSDLLSPVRYERAGDDLKTGGLYLDMPAWGYHLFNVIPTPAEKQSGRPEIRKVPRRLATQEKELAGA